MKRSPIVSPVVGSRPESARGEAPEHGEPVAVEFLVEPFNEGRPGPHVKAAIDAFEGAGLRPVVGPFSSAAEGDLDAVASAVAEMIKRSVVAGADSIRIRVGPDAAELGISPLHTALVEMVSDAERTLGSTAADWDRADKQAVVRQLHERGAFLLRGAVDDIAEIMGVSRITIYNYLNAIDGSNG